jgi:hypothetical protein
MDDGSNNHYTITTQVKNTAPYANYCQFKYVLQCISLGTIPCRINPVLPCDVHLCAAQTEKGTAVPFDRNTGQIGLANGAALSTKSTKNTKKNNFDRKDFDAYSEFASIKYTPPCIFKTPINPCGNLPVLQHTPMNNRKYRAEKQLSAAAPPMA